MKRSHLQSILTAAIVDYCQNNDLYIAELYIQGTVCISSDGAPTLITQLSEKVSTNNNRLVLAAQYQRKSPDEEGTHIPQPPPHRKSVVEDSMGQHIQDHRLEGDDPSLTRYEHASVSESALRKHRRKSDPGHWHHPRYSSEFHRDVQSFRWSVDSIPETVSSKYASVLLSDESHRKDLSPERRLPYHHSDVPSSSRGYPYKAPKEEPVESQGHHKHLLPQQHSEVTRLEGTVKTTSSHHNALTEARTPPALIPSEEVVSRGEVADLWRTQREQAVSAAALAVYNYMHSPTYHTADTLRSATALSAGHDQLSRSGRRELRDGGGEAVHGGCGGLSRQPAHVPGSSANVAATATSNSSISSTTVSGNHLASPPLPSPHSIHPPDNCSPGVDSQHPSTSSAGPIHHHHNPQHRQRNPPYATNLFRPSRDLPLSLPLDYTAHCGLTSPTGPIKSEVETMDELHVVTRHLPQHVPSMVSPSAQAAASAMAALSSLQASIMPSCPPPPPNKTSPISTSSAHSQGELDTESPPPEEPEPSPTTESPLSESGGLDMAGGMTAAGCIQIPDAPVNSHFRKMMLKSLQGKYKVLKTAEGRYKCPVCGVSYVYQPNLRKHLEKVHLGKSYKCEFCGQKFTSVQGYSFHRKVKHRDLMPYRCELCRDAFYSYTAFLQHKKRSHSNHPECIAITHKENLSLQKARQMSEVEKEYG